MVRTVVVEIPDVEPHAFVKCRICGKKFKTIEHSHLKTHGYTIQEYESEFPNAPRISTKTLFKLFGHTELKEKRMKNLIKKDREKINL